MSNKFRIAVIGMGGVGGFVGGKLAARFQGSDKVEIIFIARGANLEAIRVNGLKLVTGETEMIVYPDIVTDTPQGLGPIDLILCCTKTYHLEESVRSFAHNITAETLILPLFNGVDHAQKIRDIFPEATVLDGCIYIVSKLLSPGVIKQSGNFYSLHFGSSTLSSERSSFLDKLFSDADIPAVNEKDIEQRLWNKFLFISPIATYTTALNISIGRILESPEHSSALKELMAEIILLAQKKGISLPADTIAANFEVMAKLPYEATSSMQHDFTNGRQTEVEALTGYIVREARQFDLSLKKYETFYQQLVPETV